MNIRFYLVTGYGGRAEAGVEIDGKQFVIDREHLTEVVEALIRERGYTVGKTKRQKYERLFIKQK